MRCGDLGAWGSSHCSQQQPAKQSFGTSPLPHYLHLCTTRFSPRETSTNVNKVRICGPYLDSGDAVSECIAGNASSSPSASQTARARQVWTPHGVINRRSGIWPQTPQHSHRSPSASRLLGLSAFHTSGPVCWWALGPRPGLLLPHRLLAYIRWPSFWPRCDDDESRGPV